MTGVMLYRVLRLLHNSYMNLRNNDLYNLFRDNITLCAPSDPIVGQILKVIFFVVGKLFPR